MPYRIAICDDSRADADYVARLTDDWAKETGNPVSTEVFLSGESFLFAFSEDKAWDILLLDIEMGGMDGVTLAKKIRKASESAEIISITGYSDYISEGYEVAALHYLMKPINENKLKEVLTRAVVKLKKNERCLSLDRGGEMVLVPFYEIRYLEVVKNYVTVHGKESCTVKKTLGDFEKELDERFYRMGRSFIVNLNEISSVTKTDVILKDGTALPLPRGQYESINREIIKRN